MPLDSGIFFDTAAEMRRPDFRIATEEGLKFFVEVKNYRAPSLNTPFRIKKWYLDSMVKYAESWNLPLKFAIYWSGWNMWTLIDATRLDRSAPAVYLSLPDAIKMSEMSLIGDVMIGTKAPLALRIHADPSKPRSVSLEGKTFFTVGHVSLSCAGNEIVDKVEQQLAWFLMQNGQWSNFQDAAEVKNNALESIGLELRPEEPIPDQGFDIVGTMSSMISSQYRSATSKNGVVTSLSPACDVTKLGVLIPRSYVGTALPLWRFTTKHSV